MSHTESKTTLDTQIIKSAYSEYQFNLCVT